MPNKGRYSDYLKSAYIRYALYIVGLTFILFVAFIMLNLFYTTIQDNRLCNTAICQLVSQEFKSEAEGISTLADSSVTKDSLRERTGTTGFYQKLYSYNSHSRIKPVFTLFNSKGAIIATSLYYPNQTLYARNPRIQDALALASDSPQRGYSGISGAMLNSGQSTSYIFIKCVTDHGSILGYLCLDWMEASLNQSARKNSADIIVLTDRFDTAFYTTSGSVLNDMNKCKLDWSGHVTTVDNRPYYGIAQRLPGSQINVITLSSVWTQRQITIYIVFFLLFLGILIVILVFLFADKVSKSNSRVISELLNAVSECGKGNIDYRISTVTFEEFQTLYDAFNGMMSQLQQSFQRNNELMERKRIMEVKHLEEQFNPHFVFNVMETIKYEIMSNPGKAAKMVVTFGNLMRYSVNYGNARVTIGTDIAYIKDYLKLQKVRYGRRLSYKIEIEPDLLGYKIPKLLIQPIVENSLSHGAQDRKHIAIDIRGYRSEDSLIFTIDDDGCGIEERELDRIHKTFSDDSAKPEHIGLYNVHKVLTLLYGEPYGLRVSSHEGLGTKVVLTMPIREDEDDA